jgi:chitinase
VNNLNIFSLARTASFLGAATFFQFAPAQKLVVAYVPNWNDLPAFTSSVDLSKVTDIDIAFENPVDDQGNLSFTPADAGLIQKAHANHVKVLLSIGGGDASDNKPLNARYFSLQADGQRSGFVQKIVEYLNLHNFDGLDVDLEGASIGKDYGAFIADLSAKLLPTGKLLTAAVSEGNGAEKIPNSVFGEFSFVNVMAYDDAGPWNPNAPGQHSSMEFTKASVSYWLNRGLPKSKCVVGVPFYGYGFGTAFRNGDYPYSEIVQTYPNSENLDQVGNTIWYNGLPTIRAKAKYVLDDGLAGIMIWSLDSDAKGDKSLLNAIYRTLHAIR